MHDVGKTIADARAEPWQLKDQQISLRARVMKVSKIRQQLSQY